MTTTATTTAPAASQPPPQDPARLDEDFAARAVERDQGLRAGTLRLWVPWTRPEATAGAEGQTEGATR
jgi:hypothetical protein